MISSSEAADSPRVLLADADQATRSSLRDLLDHHGFTITSEASDADTAIELAVREVPDLCVVEVELPGGGIRAAAGIAAKVPGAAVVMLTSTAEPDDLVDAVRSGAAGYLLKDMNTARIPDALRGVLAGEAAIPRTLVAMLVDELRSRGGRREVYGRDGRVTLTRRECDVLDLMRKGLTTRQIADRLFVEPVTVRRHASAAVRKLGVADRDEAVGLYEQHTGQTRRRRTA